MILNEKKFFEDLDNFLIKIEQEHAENRRKYQEQGETDLFNWEKGFLNSLSVIRRQITCLSVNCRLKYLTISELNGDLFVKTIDELFPDELSFLEGKGDKHNPEIELIVNLRQFNNLAFLYKDIQRNKEETE